MHKKVVPYIGFGEDVLLLYYCTFEAEHATTSDPNYARNDLVVSIFPLGSYTPHICEQGDRAHT